MNHDQQFATSLATAFEALSHDTGIYQDNLYSRLGSDLPALWHIAPDDQEWAVRTKVVWQLERLIQGVKDSNDQGEARSAQTIARLRFNLLNVPGFPSFMLERRVQHYQREHHGASSSTTQRVMNRIIVPSFVAQLSHGPLPPTPDAVLALAREASAEVHLSEVVDEPQARSAASPPRPSKWWLIARLVVAVAVLLTVGGVVGWFVGSRHSLATGTSGSTSQSQAAGAINGPTGTGVYRETAGSGGAVTYRDPHALDTNGLALKAYQQVTVTCKIYAPVMASLGPGWWYRIQTAPWIGQFYAPANSFLNGDPIGVDVHHVDNKVPTCP